MRDTLQEYPINALNKTHRSTIKISSVLSLSSHFTYLSLSLPTCYLLSSLSPTGGDRCPGFREFKLLRRLSVAKASSPSFFFSVPSLPFSPHSFQSFCAFPPILSSVFLSFFIHFRFLPFFFVPSLDSFLFLLFCIASFTPVCPNFSFSIMDFFLPLLFPHFIFPFLSSFRLNFVYFSSPHFSFLTFQTCSLLLLFSPLPA